jgi:carboxymethylenebutenolidase
MRYLVLWVLAACTTWTMTLHGAAERLFYMSEGKVLQGCVYKPAGDGPFPAIVFNQNSSKPWDESGPLDPYPEIGRFFTSKGYVVFLPGKPKSSAASEPDEEDEEGAKVKTGQEVLDSAEAYVQTITPAMLSLKAQSFVDPNRIVLMGVASGASATLLVAAENLDVRGYIAFSPASGVWKRSDELRNALLAAAKKADAPIFVLQPQNDFSLTPCKELGSILESKGPPNKARIYPAYGQKQKESRGFATKGTTVWGNDVLKFIRQVMKQ